MANYPEEIVLAAVNSVQGTVRLPGSKSLTNRALLLASLSQGDTILTNILRSDDTTHMLHALSLLGIRTEFSQDGLSVMVHGCGGSFPVAQARLFLGNAGTAMRPLTAALCLGHGDYLLEGEPRMMERPIRDLVDALISLGARIDYLALPGYPPLRIHAQGLSGGATQIRGDVSSQFLSALLRAAPLCQSPLSLQVQGELISKPYVRITLEEMRRFGVEVENHDDREFHIPQKPYRSPGQALVEGDASSASYFLAAAAIAGGPVRVLGVGKASVQGDIAFAKVLEKMGAQVSWGEDWIEVSRRELRGVDLDLNHIPDAAMTVAILALFAKGSTCIRNIASWRVKETDRLSAMATELRKVGAQVEEGNDFLRISPPAKPIHARIATYQDHRMAMCFSLVAVGGCPVTILNPGCVSKTFPDYFDVLASLCHST
ncbi:MAG TPA: 3-phosphoshikimate 1-carboxyvinyltransferase [Fibrobacteraceae bacterium]|nr:3-phosphoshikimate 1-carboxyvinyltransferase [Fibrobacteraceae bacterium]